MDAHQAQSEPNTLTSTISTLKKKWILKMSLWKYCLTEHMLADFFYQTPTWQSVQMAMASDHGF